MESQTMEGPSFSRPSRSLGGRLKLGPSIQPILPILFIL